MQTLQKMSVKTTEIVGNIEQDAKKERICSSFAIVFLFLVICVQFFYIVVLQKDFKERSSFYRVGEGIPAEATLCGNEEVSHTIFKRQVWRGPQVCPPGCVRRKRRKGPFGAVSRPESVFQPQPPVDRERFQDWDGGKNYGYGHGAPGEGGLPGSDGGMGHPGSSGEPGGRGQPGSSGEPGGRGQLGSTGEPGGRGQPGSAGEPGGRGQPGSAGEPGGRGQPGSAGEPGGRGQPGMAGQPGSRGQPGMAGQPGSRGQPGMAGQPGSRGQPGMAGQPGGRGHPGMAGSPGGMGSQGGQGPSGARGQPGAEGSSYSRPSVRSGINSRGDQSPSSQDYNEGTTIRPKPPPQDAAELLREFRLYQHPKCKDEVDHRALMDTLKDHGKVSFMILIDLQDNEYCILHS